VLIVVGFAASVCALALVGILAIRSRDNDDELWRSLDDLRRRIEAIDDATGGKGHLLYLDRLFSDQVSE
jgi:hypothetical protein